MAVNNFLPFCPVDSGTNLIDQTDYAASAARTGGNVPGIASSALNNKAIRQGTYVVSQLAQLLSNVTNTDLLDNATPAQLLAQMNCALGNFHPVLTTMLSGSGNYNPTFFFGIAAGNATAGATYTNNSITFTVSNTISAGIILEMTGAGAPAPSGTLTKASGTGDATILFYAIRAPARLRVRLCGGGGGGAANSGANGTDGNDTTFGTSLLVGGGGKGGNSTGGFGGIGGAGALGTGPKGIASYGGSGAAGQNLIHSGGGSGGVSFPYGGNGGGALDGNNAIAAPTNTGGGGGGGGGTTVNASGAGGGGGGGVDAIIYGALILAAIPWVVGTGGAGATGSGTIGGAGSDGRIDLELSF